MNKDPLSNAQETIEAYFNASPSVRAAMALAVKNIDGFTKSRGTKQVDVTSESDVPSIKLIPVGGPCNLNFASNATNWDFSLQIGVMTGDKRFNAKLGPVAWAVYAAMTQAIDDGQLVGLTLAKCLPDDADTSLRSYQYIKNITLENIATGFADLTDPKNRGIAGFSSLMDLTLHMLFPRTFVKAWATQTLSS